MASRAHTSFAANAIPAYKRTFGEPVTYRQENAGDGVEITGVVQIGTGMGFQFGDEIERADSKGTVKVEAGDLPSGSPQRGDSVAREDGVRWYVVDWENTDAGWLTLNVEKSRERRFRGEGGA